MLLLTRFCLCFINGWGHYPDCKHNVMSVLLFVWFFGHNSCWLLADTMLTDDWQVLHAYRLDGIMRFAGCCLLLIGCMHNLCGVWFMTCVFVSRFVDFLAKWVRTWCVGKFPGQLGPQIVHVYVPPWITYLVLWLLHSSAPIKNP